MSDIPADVRESIINYLADHASFVPFEPCYFSNCEETDDYAELFIGQIPETATKTAVQWAVFLLTGVRVWKISKIQSWSRGDRAACFYARCEKNSVSKLLLRSSVGFWFNSGIYVFPNIHSARQICKIIGKNWRLDPFLHPHNCMTINLSKNSKKVRDEIPDSSGCVWTHSPYNKRGLYVGEIFLE